MKVERLIKLLEEMPSGAEVRVMVFGGQAIAQLQCLLTSENPLIRLKKGVTLIGGPDQEEAQFKTVSLR